MVQTVARPAVADVQSLVWMTTDHDVMHDDVEMLGSPQSRKFDQ